MSECPAVGVLGVHHWNDDVEATHCVNCGADFIPDRLEDRPRHGRFPIPFVTYIDPKGVPDFKVHDNRRRQECADRRLCQLCGHSLEGEVLVFVGQEGSIERGVFGEPPMHEDCMEFAWRVCPWLAGREWSGRWRNHAEELTILPKPGKGKLGIWVCTSYEVVPDDEGSGSVKWVPSEPIQAIEWRER